MCNKNTIIWQQMYFLSYFVDKNAQHDIIVSVIHLGGDYEIQKNRNKNVGVNPAGCRYCYASINGNQ